MRMRSILLGVLLVSPAAAFAGQETHFVQGANYCNPLASYIQGQLSFFNPSSESVTVEVAGSLLYSISGGSAQRDTKNVTVTVAPGQTAVYVLPSTQAGYGCHGHVRFFGSIRATSNWGYVVASGNLLTTMIPISGNTQTANVPFAVPMDR